VQPDGSACAWATWPAWRSARESYGTNIRFNGQPAAGMAIKLASRRQRAGHRRRGAAKLEKLEPYFPPG
jgi:multidrug efflux pump subunit AcrB